MSEELKIILAEDKHKAEILNLVQSIFSKGDTYPYNLDSTLEEVEKIGFVPECFNHKTEGLIGAYIMHKKL